MILWFVGLYLLASVGIGLYAAGRVHSTKDFAVAGRTLPLPVVTATVFATWFGAETVLGIPATFVKEGLRGVVADPFGSSLCLILAGLFFARRLYRLNVLTIGDYYRIRYNRTVEVLCTLCIVASYLGWVSAQIKALGLIMGGMLYIASVISGLTGGVAAVVTHAASAGKLAFFPSAGIAAWIPFIGAWMTMMLGSIPQQDVFQRITSAKDERTAVRGSVLGGSLYFFFAFVPMFLAYSATLVDPGLFGSLLAKDSQLVLPTLILQHTPLSAQVIFFGAALSAIMSCSSATLLAPSVAFSENILKGIVPGMSDRIFLMTMRTVLVCFTAVVLAFALNSDATIFKMVESAYKITLVSAFIPLFAGLYWPRATSIGALLSIGSGVSTWITLELFGHSAVWPPQLAGFLIAAAGMIVGSLLSPRHETNFPPARRSLPA